MSRAQRFWLACVLVSAGGGASNLLGDTLDFDEIANDTGVTQRQLSFVYSGGPLTNISSPLGPDRTFEYAGSPDFPSTTFSYDAGSGLSTITFSGRDIAPGGIATGGLAFDGSALTGLPSGADGVDRVFTYWGSDPNSNQVPALTTAINATGGGADQVYLLLYSSIQQGVSDVISQVSEYLVNVGASIQALLENGSSSNIVPNDNGPLFHFDVGFQFSNTQIPLDDLNTSDYPPSSFTPLPGVPDGTPIAPNGYAATDAFVVPGPEPSSVVLLGLGAVMLLACRRRLRSTKA